MYNYDELTKDSRFLIGCGYRVEYIGTTVYGKRIPAFLRGQKPHTLIVGGTHAREVVTCKLVVELAKGYKGDGICFVPMLNIDGVEIVEKGLSAVPGKYLQEVQRATNGQDLRLWKANGRCVDINVNYDADWGSGKSNIFLPSSENYVGRAPESEPETVASVDLVRKYGFDCLISYHAKGEVIYAGYGGVKNEKHANALSELIGYPHREAKSSAGGFKDWFIKKGFGDGYTIEVGKDEYNHPLDENAYPEIYSQNKDICALLESKEWISTKNL